MGGEGGRHRRGVPVEPPARIITVFSAVGWWHDHLMKHGYFEYIENSNVTCFVYRYLFIVATKLPVLVCTQFITRTYC